MLCSFTRTSARRDKIRTRIAPARSERAHASLAVQSTVYSLDVCALAGQTGASQVHSAEAEAEAHCARGEPWYSTSHRTQRVALYHENENTLTRLLAVAPRALPEHGYARQCGPCGPSFAYSLPMHPVHTRRDRLASLPPCCLCGAVIPRAPPLGPGRALTLPCGWNNAGKQCLALAGALRDADV